MKQLARSAQNLGLFGREAPENFQFFGVIKGKMLKTGRREAPENFGCFKTLNSRIDRKFQKIKPFEKQLAGKSLTGGVLIPIGW